MNAREMKGRMQDWQHRATEKARNVSHATDHYVREHTWSTIAAAALIGCMLGYVLASGRHEHEED